MNRLIVLLAVTVLVFTQYVRSADKDEEGTFTMIVNVSLNDSTTIIQGNCTNALARELVYREHVHKYAIPLVERNATSSWYGNEKIYCLKALNENNATKGGIAFIKQGGVNHSFVTIEMHSKRGNSLEYDVQLYAK